MKELSSIFSKYDEIFDEQKSSNAWFYILTIYVLLELLKKDKSFYYPYLRCLPTSDFTVMDWPQHCVDACKSTFVAAKRN